MAFPDDAPRAHFETAASWRTWLENHHASEPGIFVISWRTPTGRPAMAYEEMIEEALCFGWVDSRQVRLDDERSMLWFTPRRRGSGWSRSNKERVERLVAAGRMRSAGLAVVDVARADGSWHALDEFDLAAVPPDLTEELARHEGATETFETFPPSVRRAILQWIAVAKAPTTRARRIEDTAVKAARGERAHQ